MEKLIIDFNGYMECDKDDIAISVIDEKTGILEPVNVYNLTSQQIIDGIDNGTYYLNFQKCYERQLDGRLETEIVLDDE